MTSYGDIIEDSCIITFNLNCIMQLKQFYNIATKVSSRKKCYYFWWSTWLLKTALGSFYGVVNLKCFTGTVDKYINWWDSHWLMIIGRGQSVQGPVSAWTSSNTYIIKGRVLLIISALTCSHDRNRCPGAKLAYQILEKGPKPTHWPLGDTVES